MPNRLASETSPYLLQHAHNPVDWYPWGTEALERARAEDRPIFLSIGYSACHWCHVMERESFEHAAIADCLNEHFISIKVDREERPDLDQIYMAAVMALRNGQGGWPLSAFLTPKLEVFFGGTYWPPSASRGMPGFDHVLNQVLKTYRTRREDVETQAGKLTRYLQDSLGRYRDDQEAIDVSGLKRAVEQLDDAFDETHGGFGHAPKFPHAMDIQLLQRLELIWPSEERIHRERIQTMVQSTLNEMANGGIYDHLGGGFARYSTDDCWLVPHFEKMLYDNALLMSAYVDQWRRTKHPSDAQLIQQMAAFIEREMTDESGAFYSTLDADSEGIEGQYYVWTNDEIRQHLPVEVADFFCEAYGVTPAGNFEGKSVLFRSTKNSPRDSLRAIDHTDAEVTLGECRAKLFDVREQRTRPATDTKILVSWNALMIDALARAAAATSDDDLLQMATRAASAIRDGGQNEDGALLHQLNDGEAGALGFLDDYAYLVVALVSLYQADGQVAWLDWAINLADRMLRDFGDEGSGGFFYSSQHHETLIARSKDFQDSSVPSGNAMAALGLLRLHALTGTKSYEKAAASTLRAGRALWSRSPAAAGQLLIALDAMVVGITQLVFVSGKDSTESHEVLKAIQQTYLPRSLLVIHSTDNELPVSLEGLLNGRSAINQEPTLYVCEEGTCRQPAVGTAAIMAELEKLQNPPSLKFD